MFDASLEAIKKIAAQHNNDERQLEIIFSDDKRLVVEAPAGYGKTTTMISRIAYLFASGRISNPKRILGLTFSVNAALKIKREVAAKLPLLLDSQNSPVAIGEKTTVTNYHGFCKGILKKYEYLVADVLRKDINMFYAVGGSNIKKLPLLKTMLTDVEFQRLEEIETAIKGTCVPDAQTIHTYNELIIKKLLPLGYVTHNAIILFVLEIFENYPEVKKFYQSFYPLIVVDEFQDTNCIAWELLQAIISDQTQLLFFGDPLQRIYGFIGALPNIMSVAAEKYGMTKVTLLQNYRFQNNIEMLKLEKNIRANAACCFAPVISEEDMAELPGFWGITQEDEANQIATKVQNLVNDGTEKIAILFCGRGKNTETIEAELVNKDIPYFYELFTDEDTEYVEFHSKCQEMFIRRFGNKKTINKRALISFCNDIQKQYEKSKEKSIDSLLRLLDALVKKSVH